ncbi:MAG: hypothetical protein U9R00_00730 [Patescibacteria group bacterium]|nr:hypothetical protein [Patescibacteria group bacterium]
MKKNPKTKKTILIIVLIVCLGIIIFYFFNKNKEKDNSTLKSRSSDEVMLEDNNEDLTFLSTLLSLNNITIDLSLFSNESFKSLEDNTVQISKEEEVGRNNPFAPFDKSTPADDSDLLNLLEEN